MVDQVWQTRLASGDPLEALLHAAQVRVFTISHICIIVAGSCNVAVLLHPYVSARLNSQKFGSLWMSDIANADRRGSGQMGGGQGHQAQ